ncbi:hypothetical protein VCUG_01124 [Vavraia culicis subsp. floridensis]|uniref:Uncharacterized protein n=1 Tax=Vavraia culicis (isolate floridensis) TaxID=948595 RepID=L2GW72_VAVCU|nr:uncharacterized protein VCUG_01124 [Vavraia culicis subsp. floridensis]ELA47355.1 hypothetical protein VCUG_01124 [Vavraia culicis subsp. floridensis]
MFHPVCDNGTFLSCFCRVFQKSNATCIVAQPTSVSVYLVSSIRCKCVFVFNKIVVNCSGSDLFAFIVRSSFVRACSNIRLIEIMVDVRKVIIICKSHVSFMCKRHKFILRYLVSSTLCTRR